MLSLHSSFRQRDATACSSARNKRGQVQTRPTTRNGIPRLGAKVAIHTEQPCQHGASMCCLPLQTGAHCAYRSFERLRVVRTEAPLHRCPRNSTSSSPKANQRPPFAVPLLALLCMLCPASLGSAVRCPALPHETPDVASPRRAHPAPPLGL